MLDWSISVTNIKSTHGASMKNMKLTSRTCLYRRCTQTVRDTWPRVKRKWETRFSHCCVARECEARSSARFCFICKASVLLVLCMAKAHIVACRPVNEWKCWRCCCRNCFQVVTDTVSAICPTDWIRNWEADHQRRVWFVLASWSYFWLRSVVQSTCSGSSRCVILYGGQLRSLSRLFRSCPHCQA